MASSLSSSTSSVQGGGACGQAARGGGEGDREAREQHVLCAAQRRLRASSQGAGDEMRRIGSSEGGQTGSRGKWGAVRPPFRAAGPAGTQPGRSVGGVADRE